MNKTRNFVAAFAVSMAALPAFAGSLDPVIEAPLIVEEAEGSSSGTTIVALLALLMALPVLSD